MRSFEDIKDRIESDGWKPESIGTQSEQTVHRAIKYWISPDPTTHEVRLAGRIADVFFDGRVYEIQTRSFFSIRPKVEALLRDHPVTVVYPVVRRRTIQTIGADGVLGKGRVSPKRRDPSRILAELHGFAGLVGRPGLDFMTVAFDAAEYRAASNRDARSPRGRVDLYPRGIPEVGRYASPADFAALLPPLPDPFTVKDIGKALRMNATDAGRTALFLREAGIAELAGKQGRAFSYRIVAVTL